MKANTPTLKTLVINLVEQLGRPASWSELHEFLIMRKVAEGRIDLADYLNNKRDYRGWYASYFNESTGWMNWVPKGQLLKPTKSEPRYLIKNSQGLYEIAA